MIYDMTNIYLFIKFIAYNLSSIQLNSTKIEEQILNTMCFVANN